MLDKFLPKKEHEEDVQYYWSLVIEPDWIQAGIWRIRNKKVEVMTKSPPTAWGQDDDISNAADTALSGAIQDFPEDLAEPEKCVFGLSESWVDGGEIKKEYLDVIKKICTELSLKPAGFVVLSEAMAFLTKVEEGSPLTGVVVGIYKEFLEVSLFKLGNLEGKTKVARSIAVTDDIVEGLTRIAKNETIPSRFILYDGKEGELEDARQAIINADWNQYETLKFLHSPKVEIIDVDKKVLATSLAGGSEMSDITQIVQEVKEPEPEEEQDFSSQANKNLEDLGFAVEKDVSQEETDLGDLEEDVENVVPVQGSKDKKENKKEKSKKIKLPNFTGVINKLAGIFAFLKLSRLKKTPLSFKNTGSKVFIFGILSFLLLAISGFAAWWYLPKASIVIYLSPKKLEETIEIKVDPSANSADISERILPAEKIETAVSGDKTKSSTGVKTVGEKAKGEVTLYRVGSSLTLKEGTLVNGPSNLNFTLEDEVEIASGSASSPSTTKAQVLAEDIGSDYNLAAETSFTIEGYSASDIEAKNEGAFSGGSSKEINIVSEEDITNLEEDLRTELLDRAKENLEEKVSADSVFIDESIEAQVSSRDFSKKAGDEAESIKLSMDIDTVAYTVSKEKMAELAKNVLEDKIPDKFVLRKEQIDVEFSLKESAEEVFIFDSRVVANLLPEVDPEEIANQVRGKYPQVAQEYMKRQIPGFARAKVTITPYLPGKLNSLPRVVDNIDIEISAQR